MKKSLAILAVLTMIISLAACGSKENNGAGNDENPVAASNEENTAELPEDEDAEPEDFPGGLAEDGAQIMKIEGVDYNISLVEPAVYWHQDVDTMEYNNDADDECGITVWARDSAIDGSTVCMNQIIDQTYYGTSAEAIKMDMYSDCTFETVQVGEYTLYYSVYRENGEGYKEAHMYVDFNGCTLSFAGCYYNFETFCEFLEATLQNISVEKIANN